jgi:hypothetical protein
MTKRETSNNLKTSLIVLFLVMLSSAVTYAQQAGDRTTPVPLPGAVHGDIVIKEVSGNNIGNFACGNLTVYVSKLGGSGWQRHGTATGNFGSRRCSFKVSNVPAGEPFVAVLKAEFPHGCDEKKFETTTSFPMKLKGREQMRYNFAVARIRCVLVK